MFLIREIDKILENVASPDNDKRGRETERLRLSLADVEQINVENFQLATKIRYPFGLSSNAILDDIFKVKGVSDLDKMIPIERQMTTDGLIASLLIPLLASKLTKTQHYYYPYSKLVICDRISYDLLLKFQRVLFVSSTSKPRNIFYKAPFDVTAIFLLDDLIDLIDRHGEQVYFFKYDAKLKRNVANYNYSIIRKTIPFLKVSDLIIILHNKKNLELGNFDMKSNREHQILQLFNHFARTSELIELKSLTKLIGRPHLIFNNILDIQPFSETGESKLGFLKPNLSYLSSMAETLVQLASKLSLDLISISYRTNDVYNQTKMFTEFVSTAFSSQSQISPKFSKISARVLVVDRFHDLRSPLIHADKYGAFLDQERHSRTLGERPLKSRIETVDELDELLQLDSLTEVLSSILKFSVNLKPKDSFNSGGQPKPKSPMLNSNQPLLAMTTSQSICRHLDRVKAIYKCLSEGYLFIVRIESNLENIASEIRDSKNQSLSIEEQTLLVDRVQRALAALKQLIKISGKSIGVSDMIRIACILNDVINLLLSQIKVGKLSSESSKLIKTLNEIKSSSLRSKEFKKLLKPMLDNNDEVIESSERSLIKSLDSYDKLSCENYHSITPPLSLEQVVEKFFHSSEIGDDTSYSTVYLTRDNLTGQTTENRGRELIILAFLGSMSHNELSRLKTLERSLKRRQPQQKDLITLVCDILKPEDFLKSL